MPRIRLDQIVFDAGTQIRAALNESVVGEYADRMTDGVQFPPVVLFSDGCSSESGAVLYYMADGFHRAQAALRNQFRDIDADVRPGTKQDALWFALGANRANGQRLTEADKKHAILLAFKEWPDRSATHLSEQIGCNQDYVSELRRQVKGSLDLPDRVTGKDGKSYPASRSTMPLPSTTEPPKFRSREAAAQRRKDLRSMAERGFTTRQIAAALVIDEKTVAQIAKAEGVVIHADRAVGKTKRHNATRIVETIVMDAEHLTSDVNLIEFDELPTDCLARWIDSLHASHKSLSAFIHRLKKECARVEVA